jgi:DNA ligase-1
MPPKRQTRATTPPSNKKKPKHKAQPSIDAFFTSPRKAKTNGHAPGAGEVISIDDSDDDIQVVEPASPARKAARSGGPKQEQVEEDAALAMRLAAEWNAGTPQVDKGKNREMGFGDWDIEDVNGAGSSRRSASPPAGVVTVTSPATGVSKPDAQDGLGETTDASPSPKKAPMTAVSPKKEKSVHPMFAAKPAPKRESETAVKRERTPIESKPLDVKPAITSTSADPVEPIDFDTDAFLFRPSAVDTSAWPKGRLPYSVLVGVYVQVSSTRSRLTIVRVLTK